MKKLLLLPLLFITSCKTDCADPSSLASKVSDMAINKWQCKNEALVRRDVAKWMSSKGLCIDNKEGLVSGIVCPFVAEIIRKKLANQIPKEWECNQDLIGKDAAFAFGTLCSFIPY